MKINLAIAADKLVVSSIQFGEEESPTPLPKIDNKVLTEKLLNLQKNKIGLLPPAVRWISGSKRIAVFERPPMMQSISYHKVTKDEIHSELDPKHKGTVELPIPWTVYVVFFDIDFNPVEVRAYFRTSPIESIDDSLSIMPLPNFYSNGRLCNPVFGTFEDIEPTLANGINAAYNMVWNSGFNYDLLDACKIGASNCGTIFKDILTVNKNLPATYAEDTYSRFFKIWEKCSIEDVLCSEWPDPAVSPGQNGFKTTVAEAIRAIAHSVGESKKSSKEFIVHITNALNN